MSLDKFKGEKVEIDLGRCAQTSFKIAKLLNGLKYAERVIVLACLRATEMTQEVVDYLDKHKEV